MPKSNTFNPLETIEALFNHPGMVGFNNLARELQYAHRYATSSYPPRNIIQTGENSWAIEVAVAGFRPEEIGVELNGNRLIINGTSNDESNDEDINYVHHGMARRNWVFTIQLGDHVKVDESRTLAIQNGVLMISLVREIPEATKPKQFKVEALD